MSYIPQLLLGSEVDDLLRYRIGQSERLARKRKIPHITLPDGSIRFPSDEIAKLIAYCPMLLVGVEDDLAD